MNEERTNLQLAHFDCLKNLPVFGLVRQCLSVGPLSTTAISENLFVAVVIGFGLGLAHVLLPEFIE